MSRVVDLTLTLHDGDRGVRVSPAQRLKTEGWNATTLELYSHAGTHVDAPVHFGVNPTTLDQIDPSRFLCLAHVVDLHGIPPQTPVTVDIVTPKLTGRLRPGQGLLIRTDWYRHVETAAYRDQLPPISLELARWCVEKKVTLLGVEPPSVADVNDLEQLAAVHRILLEGEVVIVEGLAHLDRLHSSPVRFMVLPLKVAGSDGAPARAVALEGERMSGRWPS